MLTNHEMLGDMPARVTLDHQLGRAFHYWMGASGRRYLHTVFAAWECPVIEDAVFVAVRRGADGRRRVLAAGLLDPFGAGRELAAAIGLGADEIHLHLMANTPATRRAARDDLRLRHLPETDGRPLATAA